MRLNFIKYIRKSAIFWSVVILLIIVLFEYYKNLFGLMEDSSTQIDLFYVQNGLRKLLLDRFLLYIIVLFSILLYEPYGTSLKYNEVLANKGRSKSYNNRWIVMTTISLIFNTYTHFFIFIVSVFKFGGQFFSEISWIVLLNIPLSTLWIFVLLGISFIIDSILRSRRLGFVISGTIAILINYIVPSFIRKTTSSSYYIEIVKSGLVNFTLHYDFYGYIIGLLLILMVACLVYLIGLKLEEKRDYLIIDIIRR